MDAEYNIDAIISTEADAFQGLSKTWFESGGGQMYIFHKAENVPVVGQILTGSVVADKRGSLKFTKKKVEPFPSKRPQPVQTSPAFKMAEAVMPATQQAMRDKIYKADPDKLKQEYTLEQARNMSIQRQVGLKATIDLIVAGHRSYDQLIDTYADMMEILSEPDWRELEELKELEAALPSKDVLPTDKQVESTEEDEFWDQVLKQERETQ